MSRRLRDDSGSTLPLVLVYALFALALMVVGVSATSLYLERKQLFTVADGAALAAAEAWSLESVNIEDGVFAFDLAEDAVDRAVRDYLADAGALDYGGGFDRLEIVHATADDTLTATVTLRAVWRPPVASDFVPIEIPVEVTATARSVFN
ncbi:pilus assembly protein TadG-related protein [Agromyces protaetiae]|nr:pilus assembly protein TadG-related protein [Agromyces protaetiae]